MTPAVLTPGAMALRDYQQEAITAVTAAGLRGIRRPLIALPTGSGKTIVLAHVASYRRGRTLILVHRDELIQQAALLQTYDEAYDSMMSAADERARRRWQGEVERLGHEISRFQAPEGVA
jgi:superfamily II DNA or RNA helicase